MIRLIRLQVGEQEKRAMGKVIRSGMICSGPQVERFQNLFAQYAGVRHAIAVSSGTTALHAALLATGVKKGDLILTTPFTFIATANSVLYCGAKPLFCDMDPLTFNISPYEIEKALRRNPRIKALLIVHLYGLPCDMREIMRIAKKHKLLLIEDCAQAVGAEHGKRRAGSFGDAGTFSLYGTKNMTTGEGGMITTNKKKVSDLCKRLINHGRASRFLHDRLGYNYRMTDFQAAMGIEQLKRIDSLNRKRIHNAKVLSKGLKDLNFLKIPEVPTGRKHIYHQYTVRVKNRGSFIEHLKTKGVEGVPLYPVPLHKQPLYKKLGYGKLRFPNAEAAAREVVCLPIHPGLTKKDLSTIINGIRSWGKK